jgi:hypothetical protein
MRGVLVFVVVAALGAAHVHGQATTPPADIQLPKITPLRLKDGRKLGAGPVKENSGIVKSRRWPDVFWMQNDSGDEPRVYAVHRDGTVYGADRYEVPGTLIGGAINVDWEDIAMDDQGHLIVADCGNNPNDRRDLALYYLQEPSPNAGRTTWFRRVFYRYPDQQQFPAPQEDFNFDAEAVFTIGSRVYLLSKNRSDTRTKLYRLDPEKCRADEVNTLEYLDSFNIHGQATGADATEDGRRVVVCTYNAFWLFESDDPDQPLRGQVSWLPFVGGKQVEAVCFADEDHLLAGDELLGELFEIPLERFVVVRPAAD